MAPRRASTKAAAGAALVLLLALSVRADDPVASLSFVTSGGKGADSNINLSLSTVKKPVPKLPTLPNLSLGKGKGATQPVVAAQPTVYVAPAAQPVIVTAPPQMVPYVVQVPQVVQQPLVVASAPQVKVVEVPKPIFVKVPVPAPVVAAAASNITNVTRVAQAPTTGKGKGAALLSLLAGLKSGSDVSPPLPFEPSPAVAAAASARPTGTGRPVPTMPAEEMMINSTQRISAAAAKANNIVAVAATGAAAPADDVTIAPAVEETTTVAGAAATDGGEFAEPVPIAETPVVRAGSAAGPAIGTWQAFDVVGVENKKNAAGQIIGTTYQVAPRTTTGRRMQL